MPIAVGGAHQQIGWQVQGPETMLGVFKEQNIGTFGQSAMS